jgi:2-polyprenyl-3-methyl-5-hydroxy-6-metoxy-1,4-benzoquinol methylase
MNDRDIDNLTGSEEFAKRLTGVLNDGALCLMLSIGHQTGLFDTMASLPASTSAQIAEAAGLDERYVREWLAAMTTGRIVDHDPNQLTFALPPERAAWLTTGAGPANMAVPAQYIGLLALVEDKIVDCFRAGGGVPYSAYPKFQALMAQDSGAVHDAALIDVILPLVPGLVDELRAGIDVADIGCGSGHAVNLMATAYPASRFIGIDISDTGLAAGTAEAERRGLTNVRFQNQDAAGLSGSKQYNLITTFDAIHDQAHPDLVLTNIARLLRPSGHYLCVDIAASSELAGNLDHPLGPFGYTISCMHCVTVSLAAGGMGLGAMWGEQRARQMLAQAGFTSVEIKRVDGDIFNNYYVATTA